MTEETCARRRAAATRAVGAFRVGTPARRRLGHRGINHGSARDETRSVDDARVRSRSSPTRRASASPGASRVACKRARARGRARQPPYHHTQDEEEKKGRGRCHVFVEKEPGFDSQWMMAICRVPERPIFKEPGFGFQWMAPMDFCRVPGNAHRGTWVRFPVDGPDGYFYVASRNARSSRNMGRFPVDGPDGYFLSRSRERPIFEEHGFDSQWMAPMAIFCRVPGNA